MKKILILFASVTFSAGVFAQDTTVKTMDPAMENNMETKKDCVMMKDGKIMVMKGGKAMGMDKDMTMTNGTVVMTDGTVKMENGETVMMKEGDRIYMNGKMGKMKMKKPTQN